MLRNNKLNFALEFSKLVLCLVSIFLVGGFAIINTEAAPGINVSEVPTGNELNEGGSDLTLSVVLDEQPASDVVINLSSDDTEAVTVTPPTMTFGSGNWDQAQDYTLSPVDDFDTNGESVGITFQVDDALSDDGYDGIVQTIDVTVVDDDVLDLVITPNEEFEINEGDSDIQAFGVFLTEAPVIYTEAEVTSSDPAVTISTFSEFIPFTTGFFTPKPIIISAPEDENGIDEIVTLTFQYDAGSPANQTQTRTVRVVDNDEVVDETVTSVIQNPISNEDVEVTVSSSCGDLSTLQSSVEAEMGVDSEYNYPLGLISYELPCNTSEVEITWFGIDPNLNYVVRKYGPTTPGGNEKVFYDFDTTLEQVEVAGRIGLRAIFTLTDGGFGDDTEVDGMIVDPIGLAVLDSDTNSGLIRTGGRNVIKNITPFLLIFIGVMVMGVNVYLWMYNRKQ